MRYFFYILDRNRSGIIDKVYIRGDIWNCMISFTSVSSLRSLVYAYFCLVYLTLVSSFDFVATDRAEALCLQYVGKGTSDQCY